jgi:glycosyltransferase involved in cell wall biosynthesis
MLRTLIGSFLAQSKDEKELVISDDSTSNDVERLVASFNCSSIAYFRNEANLGYGRNLLASIERARGDVIVVLGDDDAFVSPYALSRYASVFEANQSVLYAYSNQLQFTNDLRMDYLFRFFQKSRLFKRGREAFEALWLTSIFIPGMAFRAGPRFRALYPEDEMLFPQLQLVGNLLARGDGYGISEPLVGGRAHGEQLGFYASKGERIKGSERHGTVELFEIFERLRKEHNLDFDQEFMEHGLVERYRTMVLKEKLLLGNDRVRANYGNFCRASRLAAQSKSLRASFIVALLSPKPMLWILWKTVTMLRGARYSSIFKPYNDFLKKVAGGCYEAV